MHGSSSFLDRLRSEKGQVLLQLQTCIESLSSALKASGALGGEALANVALIKDELEDPEMAAEVLYEALVTSAETDPDTMVKLMEAAEKVAPSIAHLLKSTKIALTYEILRSKRDVFVKELDVNSIMEACAREGIVTEKQYKALAIARQMGRSRKAMADLFLRIVEKTAEKERASKLESLERLLLAEQSHVIDAVLENGKTIPLIKSFLAELPR